MANTTVANASAGLSGKTIMAAEVSNTITGLLTFDRDPGAPFAVSVGSAVVPNLDVDKLDGIEGAEYARVSVVNTFAANMRFVDATYDIGAAGAFRPRDLYLSRNLIVGGTLNVTGAVTAAVPAGTLTGTTLAANVVTSSLTSVGVIASGTWSGSFGAVSGANLTNLTAANISAGTAGINISGSSASCSGNAATATVFQTARTINTVSFNGSAAISIPLAASSDYTTPTAWMPTLETSNGNLGATYGSRDGQYVVWGDLVWYWWSIQLASKSGGATGTVQLRSLPFAAVGDVGGVVSFMSNLNVSISSMLVGGTGTANFAIRFIAAGGDTGYLDLLPANLLNNTLLGGWGVYRK